MVMPGLINLDFADIRTVMSEMGKAMMGTGEAEGERRAIEAAEAAISNPLLDDVSMKGARGVLINITGGLDMTLFEVDEAANRIREEVDPDANIIFGSTFDEKLDGRMRISVVATGIDAELERRRPARRSARPEPAAMPPIARHRLGLYPADPDAERRQPAHRAERSPRRAPRPETRTKRGRARPAGRRGGGKRGAAQRRLYRAAAGRCRPGPAGADRRGLPCPACAPPAEAAPRPKGRVPSLIERVTGVGRAGPPRRWRRRAKPRPPAGGRSRRSRAWRRSIPSSGRPPARKTICWTSRPSCAAKRTEAPGVVPPSRTAGEGASCRATRFCVVSAADMQQSATMFDL